jgi:hypothetical protein
VRARQRQVNFGHYMCTSISATIIYNMAVHSESWIYPCCSNPSCGHLHPPPKTARKKKYLVNWQYIILQLKRLFYSNMKIKWISFNLLLFSANNDVCHILFDYIRPLLLYQREYIISTNGTIYNLSLSRPDLLLLETLGGKEPKKSCLLDSLLVLVCRAKQRSAAASKWHLEWMPHKLASVTNASIPQVTEEGSSIEIQVG